MRSGAMPSMPVSTGPSTGIANSSMAAAVCATTVPPSGIRRLVMVCYEGAAGTRGGKVMLAERAPAYKPQTPVAGHGQGSARLVICRPARCQD
jgi:hypothetical protein